MRILAFEDSYDIEALLIEGKVNLNGLTIEQKWTSNDAIDVIRDFKPDVLLLDHFMPPMKGLEILKAVNKAEKRGEIKRPKTIVGISSASFANQAMLDNGADIATIKFNLAKLKIWQREN